MQTIRHIHLECIDPSRNRRAFYEIRAETDLFGLIIIRRWGRIGTRGHPPLKMRFKTQDELQEEFDRILAVRLSRNYQICRQKEEGEGAEWWHSSTNCDTRLSVAC